MDIIVEEVKTAPSEECVLIMQTIKAHFDENFYAAQADLDGTESALQHYVETGWKEGLDPCNWFNVKAYLGEHADVANVGIEPLYHYITTGKSENRKIKDSDRKTGDKTIGPTIDPLSPKQREVLLSQESAYIADYIEDDFDDEFYEQNYSFEGKSALEHYVLSGWKDGNDPCEWFSSASYLKLNPDVRKLKQNPFFHFLKSGRKENRPYRASKHKGKKALRKIVEREFDEIFYREKYQIAESESAIEHFLNSNPSELKDPCPWFSSALYRELNSDVVEDNVLPFIHYLSEGITENLEFFNGMDTTSEKRKPISPTRALERFENSELGELAKSLLANKNESFTKNWLNFTRKLKTAEKLPAFIKSHVDLAVNFSNGQDGILLGWLLYAGAPIIWAEDEADNVWFFNEQDNTFRLPRRDVYDIFSKSEFELTTDELGFALRLPGCAPSGRITLKTLSRLGVHILGNNKIEQIGFNPVDVAKWMFGISSPLHNLSKRFESLDLSVINKTIQHQRQLQKQLPHQVMQYGNPIATPKVSLLIPLYGRIDFIEHQMLCFSGDDFIKNECEIIYVIDDPSIENKISEMAEFIFRLYGVSFKTVYGSANRGFSGANNLGAEHALGEYLLFLNSDVFPNHNQWLEAMMTTLQENPSIGVVAPRLLFADGSLQHAGIEFKYRTDLGIWINHHPQMGLDPDLDNNQELAILPAVTGACMLLSRRDFDGIGGWDTGYLIGDFEDSDLCLKLRSKGKQCAYLPTINLTHLERQSFNLTGSNDFRTKVVIYNATRHQSRWAKLLSEKV